MDSLHRWQRAALHAGLCLGALAWLPGAAHAASAFDWQGARGVLFRVTSPVAGAPDNLVLGTIHAGSLETLGLEHAKLQDAVRGARTFVDEADGSAPWSASLDHYRLLPDTVSLPQLIGGDAFIDLAAELPRLDSQRLARFKPWMAMVLLEASHVPPAPSLDGVVAAMAHEAGLRMVHLETLEDQLAALDCVPPEEYATVLEQRLADPAQLIRDDERALAFYREGDLAGWLADVEVARGLDAAAAAVMARARGCLITQRNARWTEELETLLRDGGCFVAVGAIHLAGPNGLLADLAARGFAVTPQSW